MSRTLLLISTLISIGLALPWQAPQETHLPTATANWTPAPTNNPKEDTPFLDLLRRDIYPVSVCGWIGGDVAQPAYCSTHSSCVWNSDYSIVGCCATASSNCGFYTSCIDLNSPQQTADSNEIYTCRGTSVCYSNSYPEGYTQWGCGSSDWATDIKTSYPGMTGISLQIVTTGTGEDSQPSVSQSTTSSSTTSQATSSALAATSESSSQTSADSSTASASSTASTSSIASASSTASASSSATSVSSVSTSTKPPFPVGAVAGGVGGGVGGVCLIAIIALAAFFWRRRAKADLTYAASAQQASYGPAEMPAGYKDELKVEEMPGDTEYGRTELP